MFIRRSVIASIAHILILISVVEGTCKCYKVCPNWADEHRKGCNRSFLGASKTCSGFDYDLCPSGICICNFWGCNCDGCGTHGQCGCEKCTTDLCTNNCNNDVNNDVRFLTEEKDTCTDYEFFISLSLEEKTKFLGDKYCDDGIAADDIYKKMLTYVDNNLDPNSINLDELELSCDDFNKSTYYREDTDVSAIGRKLKLCKNGYKKGHQKFNKYRKNKKKKNKNSKSE